MFANPEVPHKKTASRKKGTKTIMIRIRLFSAFPEFSMISHDQMSLLTIPWTVIILKFNNKLIILAKFRDLYHVRCSSVCVCCMM